MKKFLATLLLVGSLFFTSTADAEIVKFIGTGTATANEDEASDDVTKRATTNALRNAREQIGIYVKNFAPDADALDAEDIDTISVGLLKLIDTNVEKNSVDDKFQVRVTVTVEIDSDDLQRELDKLDKTKPVSTETIKTYTSEAAATVISLETHDQTVNRAAQYALKDIRERFKAYIQHFARLHKVDITNPEIDSVLDAVIKVTNKTVDQSLVKDTIQVRVKVTVQVDDADIERCIEEIARRKNS